MAQFADSDFLYFDSETRAIVGPVQWSRTGNVRPMERPQRPSEGEGRRWRSRKEFYTWGSYRSLKHLYHLEGKEHDRERTQGLEEAMQRALAEAYWD